MIQFTRTGPHLPTRSWFVALMVYIGQIWHIHSLHKSGVPWRLAPPHRPMDAEGMVAPPTLPTDSSISHASPPTAVHTDVQAYTHTHIHTDKPVSASDSIHTVHAEHQGRKGLLQKHRMIKNTLCVGLWMETTLMLWVSDYCTTRARSYVRIRPKSFARSVTPTAPRASSMLNACDVFRTWS